MDRCALFVDAGYLLADGAMAVHGTRRREAVSWDFGGLLQLLGNLARERTGVPLLRCYWYEATEEGRRAPEHESLADLPGLKLRLGKIRPGRREGVDAEIHRDLMTLARNGALADAVVVSGDEDVARVVADAQDFGVRVTVVHVSVEGGVAVSRVLRQECDDLVELASGQLRPFVTVVSGGDAVQAGPSGQPALPAAGPLTNGHGTGGHGTAGHGTGSLGDLAPVPRHSTQRSAPPSTPLTGLPVPAPTSSPEYRSDYGSSADYGSGEYRTGEYRTGEYGKNEYGKNEYAKTEYGKSEYGKSEYGKSEYGKSEYGKSEYRTGEYGTGYRAPGPAPADPGSVDFGSAGRAAPPPAAPPSPPSPQSSGPQYLPPQPATPPPPQQQQQPPQQHGPYTGPQQVARQTAPTLSDAVKAAHQEGQDFGESVARDAPALWLEAVLARKPRMPSDLEARLLQGSALPIDFLLHDEVRHALRRGFWDALERARR
ncbi:NYN domain-containing protein [Actinomadura atramentaria]|uniref:NYN domain-containing protein n=1 Tax=Actinomadura atramentaria TaxID=1990 RepID=UPI0003A4DEDC|nr:NYN domain-containing protein [Actinomadura atramentaria]